MNAPTYTTNDWRGFPHFECDQCPFDTLDEAEIVAHIRAEHNPPPPVVHIEPITTEVVAAVEPPADEEPA